MRTNVARRAESKKLERKRLSFYRQQLRTTFDQCVHDAMVPHTLLPLPAPRGGPTCLGSDISRGGRDIAENRARHMGRTLRVSGTGSGNLYINISSIYSSSFENVNVTTPYVVFFRSLVVS